MAGIGSVQLSGAVSIGRSACPAHSAGHRLQRTLRRIDGGAALLIAAGQSAEPCCCQAWHIPATPHSTIPTTSTMTLVSNF